MTDDGDRLTAELAAIKERAALAYASPARMAESGADVPRLVKALEAALARHTEMAMEIDNPAVPPFSYCKRCAGHPRWPCPEVADILAALTGEGGRP